MAIEVKDINGATHSVASRGVGVAGLTTGIIGTSLAGLMALGTGTGILGNLLGSGGMNPASANLAAEGASCCFVNKDMFYGTLISQINTQAERDIATERRFAGIESAIATNTAVGACNRAAIEREFEVVDARFESEARYSDLLLRYSLANATCGMVKGTPVVTPSQIGATYANPVNVLSQHDARCVDRSGYSSGYMPPAPCGGCF